MMVPPGVALKSNSLTLYVPAGSVAIMLSSTFTRTPPVSRTVAFGINEPGPTSIAVAPVQLSVAEADPVPAGVLSSLHSIVTSAGTASTGIEVSTTVMTWSALVLLPQTSVAVHVRVIVDSFAHAPAAVESAKVIAGAASQLSVAVAEPVAAGLLSSLHSTDASAGTVRTGAVLSITVMT